MTRSGKTGLIATITDIRFLSVATRKLHSCNTQKHQVLDHRWPGLHLQTAFHWCYQAMRVHFKTLEGFNRIAWGVRNCSWRQSCCGLYQFVSHTEGHCSLSPNWCFDPSVALHPHPTHPPTYPPPTHLPTPYRLNLWYYRIWKNCPKTNSIQIARRVKW